MVITLPARKAAAASCRECSVLRAPYGGIRQHMLGFFVLGGCWFAMVDVAGPDVRVSFLHYKP